MDLIKLYQEQRKEIMRKMEEQKVKANSLEKAKRPIKEEVKKKIFY
jgi:hypothetical protein